VKGQHKKQISAPTRQYNKVFFAAAMILFVSFLSGCLPGTTLTPLPTTTPTPTEVPTPSVVWFPPTETPTPVPTVLASPTPELRPLIGAVLLRDDFKLPTEWTTINASTANVSVRNNELTMVLSQPKGYIFSIREGALFTNFYTEITASPKLCNGVDEYGILVRYNSPSNFYRFSLSCDGRVRYDRVYAGTASSPQGWIPSASVPPGAPSSSRLALWAVGKEMRFFVNDQYQFTVSDPLLPSGAIGVFARSGGETAVTASFSNLIVHAIEQ
jgi:hypothetical protein